MDNAASRPTLHRMRVLEEGQVGARLAFLVRVEDVVDEWIVLIDALAHQPQTQDAGIEVDVLQDVAGDARDVMNAFEPHGSLLLSRDDCGVWIGSRPTRCVTAVASLPPRRSSPVDQRARVRTSGRRRTWSSTRTSIQ